MKDSFERKVKQALDTWSWKCSTNEGMLMLLELMVKRQSGFYSSYTECAFLDQMRVTTKSGKPNKLGREFMQYMLYASSNKRPPVFEMMESHRI